MASKKQSPKNKVKSKQSSRPVFEWAQSLLLSPDIRKLIADYQEGIIFKNEPISLPETEYQLAPLLPFIESRGDFQILGEILRKKPDLLFHPLVTNVVQYLRHFYQGPYAPHPAEQEEIHYALKKVVEGWVEGMLRGYQVTPPKKSPGRKIDWIEQEERRRLVKDYYSLLYYLRKHVERREPGAVPQQTLKAYQEWQDSHFLSISLPSLNTITSWTKSNFFDTDGFNDLLAYRLLAHPGPVTPDQIRGIIQRQRKEDFPVNVFNSYQIVLSSLTQSLKTEKPKNNFFLNTKTLQGKKRVQDLLCKAYFHLQELFFPGGIEGYPKHETFQIPPLKESHIQEWLPTLPENEKVDVLLNNLACKLVGHYFRKSPEKIARIVQDYVKPRKQSLRTSQ